MGSRITDLTFNYGTLGRGSPFVFSSTYLAGAMLTTDTLYVDTSGTLNVTAFLVFPVHLGFITIALSLISSYTANYCPVLSTLTESLNVSLHTVMYRAYTITVISETILILLLY